MDPQVENTPVDVGGEVDATSTEKKAKVSYSNLSRIVDGGAGDFCVRYNEYAQRSFM